MDSGFLYQMVLVTLLLLLLGAAPVVLPALWWQGRAGAGCERAWTELATHTGLTFESDQAPAGLRVVGLYRGRGLTLQLVPAGRRAQVNTRIRLALRWRVGELSLSENLLLTRLLKSVTLTSKAGADRPLNRRFTIRSSPAGLAARLAGSAPLRRKLFQARSIWIQAEDQAVDLTAAGIVADPEYLVFLFGLLNDAARLLEQASAPDPASG